MRGFSGWLAMAGSLAGGPALAHMPYVVPSTFDAGARTAVTVEASFTEDAFRPELAMRDAPFEVTGPDGATVRLPAPLFTRDVTLVEAALPTDGIYRLSSGQRAGRMGRMYRDGATWRMVGEGGAPPAGAVLVAVRSMTLADAYVVRGRPTAAGALAARGRALEIHPLVDPTAIGAGEAAGFEVLQDGRPLAGAEVTLFREAGLYDGRKIAATLTTDAAGRIAVTPPDAGRYLLLVRNRTAAPAGSAAPYVSYTATVAVEAG